MSDCRSSRKLPNRRYGSSFWKRRNADRHMSAEIRELRGRMWNVVAERKHVVNKVFPGSFQDADAGGATECECMLFGDVHLVTKEGQAMTVPWAGYAVLRQVEEGGKTEWKFARYRVYLQR